MADQETALLNRAIPVYLGRGASSFPKLDAARLNELASDAEAKGLSKRIDAILADLDSIVPDWSAHTLASGSTWAVEHLRRKYVTLDDEAAAALVWAHSYWNR